MRKSYKEEMVKKKNVSWSSLILPGIFISMLLFIGSCQNKPEKKEDTTTIPSQSVFSDWNKYQYKNLIFRYPQGHQFSDSINVYAKKYEAMMRRDTQILQMLMPTDTITIYFYTGIGQGREISGRDFPYVSEDSIHFWGHIHFGAPLMEYLIQKWTGITSRHHFLKNGLVALMDASGRNNHKMTSDFIENGTFLTLKDLANDTNKTVWWGWDRAIEGASFVDFIMYKYGPQTLKIMYESPVSFDSTVDGLFEISVDSLEKEWLDLVKKTNTQ